VPVTRRRFAVAAAVALVGAGVASGCVTRPANDGLPPGVAVPVAVGLPPGPEREAVRLAIREINASGGVLGRPVETVDAPGAVVVFGCGPVTRPVPPEATVRFCPADGADPDAFYTGSSANQRVVPALDYLAAVGRTALYLAVGDDEFSRRAAAIARAYAAGTGAVSVVGAGPAPAAGAPAPPPGLSRATAVLSTLDPAGTARFLTAYGDARRRPVLSLSLTEADIAGLPRLAGHLVAGSYFQSLPGRVNARFVAAMRRLSGAASGPATIGEAAQSAYVAVHVWRDMVAKAGSFRTELFLARDGLVVDAPEGPVSVDAPRRHLYRTARIGLVSPDGTVRPVWDSGAPVRPDPGLLGYPWARGIAIG
jgi:urea transport system substrate-binding protein